MDSLKTQEESNKQLKAEVRKQKAAKEKLEREGSAKVAQSVVKTDPSPVRQESEKIKESALEAPKSPKAKAPIKEMSLITLIA